LDTVLSSVNDAVIAADADSRILFWNRGAEKMFGYTEAEARDRLVTELMPERFRGAHLAAIAHLLETGEERLIGRSVQLVGQHRAGHELPIEISLGRFSAGEEYFFPAVIRDVSERERVARYRAAEEGVSRVLAESATLEEAQPALLASVGEALGWE